jgi:hypothetical protein
MAAIEVGTGRVVESRSMKGQLKVSTPAEYIAKLEEPRKSEVAALDALIRKTAPKLERYIQLGMLAYGHRQIKYADGRIAEWSRIAVASNANYISIYTCGGAGKKHKKDLPKAKIGGGCVRFKRLSDLDQKVLQRMILDCAKAKQ